MLALVVNGFLEWIRERILLSATTSFVSTIEDKVFSATFEQGTEKWNEGGQAFGNLRTIRSSLLYEDSQMPVRPRSIFLFLVQRWH